jgi:hypothetical protein
MMHVWEGMASRPTRDIDLLGPSGITEAEVTQAIHDCLSNEVTADGIELDRESVRIRPIRVAEVHVGYRAVSIRNDVQPAVEDRGELTRRRTDGRER